ncbi:hypothetical protein C8R43DRAFT_1137744 [Mycena crocata]|nr:hypothetical protein C8R43DRAFT_1137744 [Mycena crocata]
MLRDVSTSIPVRRGSRLVDRVSPLLVFAHRDTIEPCSVLSGSGGCHRVHCDVAIGRDGRRRRAPVSVWESMGIVSLRIICYWAPITFSFARASSWALLEHFCTALNSTSTGACTLTLSATYLTTPVFTLASLEALLSSRFAVLDARPGGAGGYTNDNSGYNNDNIYNNNTRSSTNVYASSSSSFPNTDTRESGAGTNPRPARTPLRPGLDTRGAGAGADAYGARSPHARGASEAYGGGRGSRDAEEDEDAEFVPTLARRSITTSSASLGVGGAGMSSSPGRQTMPLPGAGVSGSPGRYGELGRYTTNEAGRYAPTAEHGQGRYASESGRYTSLPGVGPTTPLPGASDSPGRYVSALQQQHGRQRSESTTSPSPAPSYRMGVHVASGSGVGAGYRRDVGAAGGGDVVDRFVLPRSGASSLSAQSSLGAGPGPSSLGGMRGSPSESAGVGGEYGRAPSEREREREREKGVPIGGAGGGFGGGIGTSASGSGGGLSGSPATGPSPLAINPFKSNTLSRSSLSGSLLRGVAGSPGRAMSPIAAGSGAGGAGMGGVAFPMPPPGPSGDGAAGSLGGGTPGSVGGGVGIPMRKRYSSSFPHRYGAAAGSSVGSGGSGESASASGSMGPTARERTASATGSRSGSFQLKTSPAVDEQHDDISSFVKDIDAARPLLGRYREAQQQQQDDSTRDTDNRPPSRTSGSGSNSPGTSRGGSSIGTALGAHTITPSAFDRPVLGPGGGGAMLTSESEVDERLRRMNEEFMRSLVGLGGATANSTGTRASSSGAGRGSGSGLGSGLTHSPVSGRSGGDGQGSDEVIGRLEFDFDASPQFPL